MIHGLLIGFVIRLAQSDFKHLPLVSMKNLRVSIFTVHCLLTLQAYLQAYLY